VYSLHSADVPVSGGTRIRQNIRGRSDLSVRQTRDVLDEDPPFDVCARLVVPHRVTPAPQV